MTTPAAQALRAWDRLHGSWILRGRLHTADQGVAQETRPFVRHWLGRRLAEYDAYRSGGVGVAFFPAVFDRPVDGAVGGLWRIKVEVGPVAVGQAPLAGVLPQHQSAVQAGLDAASSRGVTPAQGVTVAIFPAPTQVAVEGESLHLALAVATFSAVTSLRVPEARAFSGVLGAGSSAVLRLSEKRAVVEAAWGSEGKLLSLGAEAEGVGSFQSLGALLAHVFPMVPTSPQRPLRERLAYFWNDPKHTLGQAEALLRDGTRLLPARDVYRLAAEGVRLANHGGASARALEIAAQAAQANDAADPSDRAVLEASVAIALVDRGHFERAAAHILGQLEHFPAGPAVDSTGDLNITQLYGTLARALSASGDDDGAIDWGRNAWRTSPPLERFRNAGDLALWLHRAGRDAEARDTLDAARARVAADPELGPDATTWAFHHVVSGRVHLALGDDNAARADLDGLAGAQDLAIVLGRLELGVRLGAPATDEALRAFDAAHGGLLATPGVVSRYRARIECARGATADHAAISRWAGGFSDAELARKVPY